MVQDTAPSAVRIADPIDTIICTTNLIPSFFVIAFHFYLLTSKICVGAKAPSALILIEVIAAVAASTIITAVGVTAS